MCHVRIDSLTDVAITSGRGTNSHLNEFFFKGVWLVFPSCQNRRSSARRVTVRPPDHIRSRPPADSAVWRTAAGPPPPPSCCLSACLLAWCIQAGPQTHTGESLRLGTTLQHTGGGGGKVKGKRREGVLPNSVGDRTGLKEKNRRGKTEERLLSEKKRNPDKNKLHRSISPAFYGCQIFWTTRLCVFSQDYNSVDFCEIESRISTAVPSERSHNKSYLPSAWLQI